MNAVHSYKSIKSDSAFYMEDFEVMVMIMSALSWRRLNGKIKLYADEAFAKYVYDNNLDFLWDNGIDIKVLSTPRTNINSKIFWAASKMDVINDMKENEVHMDIDFAAWSNLDDVFNEEFDVIVSHFEPVNDFTCYIDKELLVPPKGYVFNKNLDWNFPAINTSFIMFKNKEAKDIFCKECIRYMENNDTELPDSAQMVFAEQRLTAMALKFKGVNIKTLTDVESCMNGSTNFIHLGGLKQHMKSDHNAKEHFNLACANKLIKSFPEYMDKIKQINCLKKYF